jgi:hypothetical protein
MDAELQAIPWMDQPVRSTGWERLLLASPRGSIEGNLKMDPAVKPRDDS